MPASAAEVSDLYVKLPSIERTDTVIQIGDQAFYDTLMKSKFADCGVNDERLKNK